MKVYLELVDWQLLKSWGDVLKHEGDNLTEWTHDDDRVLSIIEDAIEQAEELEELDLDDCSSGACKL